jgi:hypothetical protein
MVMLGVEQINRQKPPGFLNRAQLKELKGETVPMAWGLPRWEICIRLQTIRQLLHG